MGNVKQLHDLGGSALGSAQVKQPWWKTALSGLVGASSLATAGISPIVGAIGSALLQKGLNAWDIHSARKYNSPKAQIGRLAHAGIPAAAYFKGVTSDTQPAASVNIDPTLGTAKHVENYMQNRYQNQQIELLKQNIRKVGGEADKTTAEGKWYQKHGQNFLTTVAGKVAAEKFLQENKGTFQQMQNEVYSKAKDLGLQIDQLTANVGKTKSETAKNYAGIGLINSQKIVNSTRVQQMLQQIAESKVKIDLMHTGMTKQEAETALVNQTLQIRKTKEMMSGVLQDDLAQGNGFSGWIGSMIGRWIIPNW